MQEHRSKSPACSCLVAGVLLATVLALVLGILWLALPQLAGGLGQAAPALNPVTRSLYAIYLIARQADLDRPAGDPAMQLNLEVTPGESADEVISRLHFEGIVHDAFLLRTYLRFHGMDRGIEAGSYALSGEMTLRQIANALQSARSTELVLTVIEGWRREQIAEALPRAGLAFSARDFLRATDTSPSAFLGEIGAPPGATLEGFLFPDTYRLAPEESASDFIVAMLNDFDQRLTAADRAGIAAQGLNLFQGVTLASIVEREAVVADERPLIASVFYNRLAAGMNLDADPTVQYALGFTTQGGWWKSPLDAADLLLESPYNTYRSAGLPPGPIANPGLDSLRAVADPATSDFFYFRAMCDGSGRHAFARTFDEHLQNACP
jgi:UPF0755 protein